MARRLVSGEARVVADLSRGRRPATIASVVSRWPVSTRQLRALSLVTTLLVCLLVVTGGVVRLTGSGLGCPTWPNCTAHHLTAAVAFHPLVEFGNRVFTAGVSIGVVLCGLASLMVRPLRRDLVLLAWGLVIGVFGEAVLGGVSVLLKLLAPLVMAHFVLAIAMVGCGFALVRRCEGPPGPWRPAVPRALRLIGAAQLAALCLVIAAGTVVTGSGPHSGSTNARGRLPVPFVDAAQGHADMAWLFGGITLALVAAVYALGIRGAVRTWSYRVAALAVVQGLIGYAQYFGGDPAWLVGFHVTFATALFSMVMWTNLLMTAPDASTRRAALAANGQPAVARTHAPSKSTIST